MNVVKKFVAVLDAAIDIGAILAAVLAILVTLLVVAQVVLRGAKIQILWAFEVSEYILLYITFLGAAWVLKRGGHVSLDVLPERLNPRSAALLNAVTSIVGAIVCLLLTWYGVKLTVDTFLSGYTLYTEVEPPIWPIIAIIPIGSFLLFIQFLRMTYKYLQDRRASNSKS